MPTSHTDPPAATSPSTDETPAVASHQRGPCYPWRDHERPRERADIQGQEGYFHAPFSLAATIPADLEIVRRLVPHALPDVIAAGGCALDLERHLRGEVRVVDRDGAEVPLRLWLRQVREARGHYRPARVRTDVAS